jgi:signal peptidase I
VNWILPVLAILVPTGVLVVLLLRRRFAMVTVEGDSMRPAFSAGDRVLVRRARLASLNRGQVVVVERPLRDGTWPKRRPGSVAGGQWMIKRVAALPGDPIPPGCLIRQNDSGQGLVPSGRLVVLGDNARVSHDSRQLGLFPGDRLLGVAVRRIA